MRDRGIRRAAKARMKVRAKKLYPTNRIPEKLADHLAVCSCWMCGNPRKYFRQDTLKERAFKASSVDEE